MSLPFLRDPRQRHDRLQLILKIAVFGGMAIGGILIAAVIVAKIANL